MHIGLHDGNVEERWDPEKGGHSITQRLPDKFDKLGLCQLELHLDVTRFADDHI